MTWIWYAPSSSWPRRPLRQTHLGATASAGASGPGAAQKKQLGIVDLRRERAPRAPAYVLALPDEILCEVFECLLEREHKLAGWTPGGSSREARRDLAAVQLSCRRFARVAEPARYRVADVFLAPSRLHRTRSFRFYRSVAARPERAAHCRELYLRLPPWHPAAPPPPCDRAVLPATESVLARLANVRRLTLDGRLPAADVWDLPANISRFMPRLRSIELVRGGDHDVARLIAGLDLPLLESLHIWCSQDGGQLADFEPAIKNKLGTAPLVSLHVGQHMRRPETLASVIGWARALERFSFRPQTGAAAAAAAACAELLPRDRVRFDTLRDMLLPHADSLRHLEIDWLTPTTSTTTDTEPELLEHAGVFDACAFARLAHLELVEADLRCAPRVAAAALFVGALETLVADCYVGHRATLGPRRVEWWAQFLREVAALPGAGRRRRVVLKNTGYKWWVPDRHRCAAAAAAAAAKLPRTLIQCLDDLGALAREGGVEFEYKIGE
ncbi:hypothetical protein GGR52DRAFT_14098 [Hypoxylon sp. FL1284]|nr:hypothetical protein GGR52DRAFT_14098 [Hypoxylon sp. FL1284]